MNAGLGIEGAGWWLAAGLLFAAWLRVTAPILLAALGALVTELAGVINVGIEGLMLIAAFFGVMGAVWTGQAFPAAPAWCCAAAGALLGLASAVALALLLGVLHLELGADLIVAGIGIHLLAGGLTVFLLVSFTGDKGSTAGLASPALPTLAIPGVAAGSALDAWLNGERGQGHALLVYAALLAAALLAWVLRRTRWGLRLRAVGEQPDAARAAGLPIKRLQYSALAASGVLAGLGGVYLSMGYLTLFQVDMSAGRGFLALAAVFLGARRALGTLAASALFGAAAVLAAQLGTLRVPSQLLYMLAPAVTLLALVIVGERRLRRSRRAQVQAAARAGVGPGAPGPAPAKT